ncbi:MAG: hypothetical protein HOK65_12115 [Crocinitomicaceae bacterium]|nr:hypothetical protein [Crocinitomicaceae bacterium]
MTTIFEYLENARSYDDDAETLKRVANRVRAGDVIYTDEFDSRISLPEDIKQKTLSAIRKHLDILELGKREPDNHFYYDIQEYWHYAIDGAHDDLGHYYLDHIEILEPKKPKIIRENDFNVCLAKVIEEFTNINGYPPTPSSTLERLKMKPPHGYIVNINNEGISIDGSSPKSEKYVKESISRLL